MAEWEKLNKLIREHGFADFKPFKAEEIVVAEWVRMKCMFGCTSYGKKGTCPPNVPAVEECRKFFSEYKEAVIFHFRKRVDKPEDRVPWSREINSRLLELEREVFLSGRHKAFLLFMDECRLCDSCVGSRDKCADQKRARPSPESLAVDVYATVRKLGYPINVLNDYAQEMNRYAFLLIE
jgi:predicted metal-binding protein